MAEAPYRAEKPIALVGLMGAGKSTVGRRLAKRLALPFVDADAEIETATGVSIAEIFERQGEAHFRANERKMIARLSSGPPKVIATGGGAFADLKTRALLLERCTVVWLDGDIETFAARAMEKGRRPLLNPSDPIGSLRKLSMARQAAYGEAHLRVLSDAASPARTVDHIVTALGTR
jgi:shikimate kinase